MAKYWVHFKIIEKLEQPRMGTGSCGVEVPQDISEFSQIEAMAVHLANQHSTKSGLPVHLIVCEIIQFSKLEENRIMVPNGVRR